MIVNENIDFCSLRFDAQVMADSANVAYWMSSEKGPEGSSIHEHNFIEALHRIVNQLPAYRLEKIEPSDAEQVQAAE